MTASRDGYAKQDAARMADVRRAALIEAETAVRQALMDAAHAHRAKKDTSSGIFKSEVYATNAIHALGDKEGAGG
jgi:nucleoid-associated protein YejK